MTTAIRRQLGKPLARWGFTALAIFAAVQSMTIPALVCGAVAYTAWEYRK